MILLCRIRAMALTTANTSATLDQDLLASVGLPIIKHPAEHKPKDVQLDQQSYAQKLYSQQQQQAASASGSAPAVAHRDGGEQAPHPSNFFDPGEEQGQPAGVKNIALALPAPPQAPPLGLPGPLKLRHGICDSTVLSRGLLADIYTESAHLLPALAIPIINRILTDSAPPMAPIDFNERETWLMFWHMNQDGTLSLQQDWVELLTAVPSLLDLVPGDVWRAYDVAVSNMLGE